MGYTHYWRIRSNADVRKIGQAFVEMAQVVEAEKDILSGWDGTGEPEVVEGYVSFNGKGVNGCETFAFPPDLNEAIPEWQQDKDRIFTFCKTRREPYDKAVTACLAIAADVMGNDIIVSSDGELCNWTDGVELACRVTGREIANPLEE